MSLEQKIGEHLIVGFDKLASFKYEMPDDLLKTNQIGWIKSDEQIPKEIKALDEKQIALRVDPDYAPAYLYRGELLYEVKRDYPAAIESWKRFLALVPADTDKELNGLDKFKPVTKASGKLTPSGHPLIISLRPVSGDARPPR